MNVEILKIKGTWRDIADACNNTVGLEAGEKEPSDSWKKKILRAEHSPIRQMVYSIKLIDIPYYASVHLVRHKIGVEHFVKSQRSDRTGIDRNKLPQDSLVNHIMDINLQSLITISRKRLCNKADKYTKFIWEYVVDEIAKHDPIVASCLVPECVYRGLNCYEFKSCNYYNTSTGKQELIDYIS